VLTFEALLFCVASDEAHQLGCLGWRVCGVDFGQRIEVWAAVGTAVAETPPLGVVLGRIAVIPPLPELGVLGRGLGQFREGLSVGLGDDWSWTELVRCLGKRPGGDKGNAEGAEPDNGAFRTHRAQQRGHAEAKAKAEHRPPVHGKPVAEFEGEDGQAQKR